MVRQVEYILKKLVKCILLILSFLYFSFQPLRTHDQMLNIKSKENFVLFIESAIAKDLDKGKELFESNCNVCHLGGKNKIIPEKNLQGSTLQMNGISNKQAIIYQITNGKNGMPAFGGRLTRLEIKAIAEYVLVQFH